jgi:hypothetical protein
MLQSNFPFASPGSGLLSSEVVAEAMEIGETIGLDELFS